MGSYLRANEIHCSYLASVRKTFLKDWINSMISFNAGVFASFILMDKKALPVIGSTQGS